MRQVALFPGIVTRESTTTMPGAPVLPFDARITAGLLPRSSFALYRFADPEDPKMAVADTATADMVHTEPGQVARFEGHYDRLLQGSLSPADSLSFLGKVADQLVDEGAAEI